jgi:hypothetical protein
MHVVLVILGIHAMLIGFALLLAGFVSLVAPNESEVAASRRAYETEREKSWWRGQLFALGQVASARSRGLSLAVSHWSERPQCRKLIYFGTACLAVAAVVGYYLGVFDSLQ